MSLDGFKDGLEGFLVGGVDVFFALFLDGDEVAFEEGFEVVGYHALFLFEYCGEFVNALGFFHQLFDGGEPSGVC